MMVLGSFYIRMACYCQLYLIYASMRKMCVSGFRWMEWLVCNVKSYHTSFVLRFINANCLAWQSSRLIFRFQLEQGPNHRILLRAFLLHSRTFHCLRRIKLSKNLFKTSGYVPPQMETLDLVWDPFLICAVGSVIMTFLHVKFAMRLELR